MQDEVHPAYPRNWISEIVRGYTAAAATTTVGAREGRTGGGERARSHPWDLTPRTTPVTGMLQQQQQQQ